jgi:sirohydrochlorin cobaltochelatase
MAQGIVLFAHGSRDPLWHKPMEAVAQCIRQREPGAVVACAYLELSPPDLPTCAADLIAAGVDGIRIVPMFLGVGKHAREDLPQLVDALRLAHPGVVFELQKAVGEDARLVETLAHIAIS